MNYEVNDVIEFKNDSEVFLTISKEDTIKLFANEGITIPEKYQNEGIFIEGEIQIFYSKDASYDEPDEILIFPVYEDNSGTTVGDDYIDAPDSIWTDKEMLRHAFHSLPKNKPNMEDIEID